MNYKETPACIKCSSNVQAALSSELQFAQPKSKSALLKYIFKSLQIKIKNKQCQKDELHSGLIKAIITSLLWNLQQRDNYFYLWFPLFQYADFCHSVARQAGQQFFG